MKKFEYKVTANTPFFNSLDEEAYLDEYGEEGWELVNVEQVAVKKRVSVIQQSSNQPDVQILYKFFWKRVKDDNGSIGTGNPESGNEGEEVK